MKNWWRTLVVLTVSCMAFGACDLLDCTNYSVQLLNIELCDSTGASATVPDSLTVKACGTDSTLINRDYLADDMLLPMSYVADEDTFLLKFSGEDYVLWDTLFVTKTNDQYFESPDCPTRMMHTLLEVRMTHVLLDSAKIVNNKIGFVESCNIKLYIRQEEK